MFLAIQSFIHHFWNILFVWRSTTTSRKMLIYLQKTNTICQLLSEHFYQPSSKKRQLFVSIVCLVFWEKNCYNFHRKKAEFEERLPRSQKHAHFPDTQGIQKSLVNKSSRYHSDTSSRKGVHNTPHYLKIARQSNPPPPSLDFFFKGLFVFLPDGSTSGKQLQIDKKLFWWSWWKIQK